MQSRGAALVWEGDRRPGTDPGRQAGRCSVGNCGHSLWWLLLPQEPRKGGHWSRLKKEATARAKPQNDCLGDREKMDGLGTFRGVQGSAEVHVREAEEP